VEICKVVACQADEAHICIAGLRLHGLGSDRVPRVLTVIGLLFFAPLASIDKDAPTRLAQTFFAGGWPAG